MSRLSDILLGNKKDNLAIIYTPADNLKVGGLSFAWNHGRRVIEEAVSRKQGTWLLGRCHSTAING